MQRISSADIAVSLFGAGKNGFTDGNQSLGINATVCNAEFFNGLQEELCNLIESCGILLNTGTRTQLATAIQTGKLIGATAGGTANALTASFAPAITALNDAMMLVIRASAANTTTTPTLSVNGLTPKTIVKGAGMALQAGDIVGAGHRIILVYDATLTAWVMLNPAYGILPNTTGYMLVQEQQAQGVDPGVQTSANTEYVRGLNTVVANSISGASLASSQITLPAGTYRVNALTGVTDSTGLKATLYNLTDASVQVHGMSMFGANTEVATINCPVTGYFTIAGTKTFQLRLWVQSGKASTDALGAPMGRGIEVYSTVEIFKVA